MAVVLVEICAVRLVVLNEGYVPNCPFLSLNDLLGQIAPSVNYEWN